MSDKPYRCKHHGALIPQDTYYGAKRRYCRKCMLKLSKEAYRTKNPDARVRKEVSLGAMCIVHRIMLISIDNRYKCKSCRLEYMRNYYKKNHDTYNQADKSKIATWQKTYRDKLPDSYIKNLLKIKDLPPSLIDVKRKHLLLIRKIREHRDDD